MTARDVKLEGVELLVYFGEKWDAPFFDDVESKQTATPVGEECLGCSLPIQEGERGLLRPVLTTEGGRVGAIHAECDMLSALGHIFGVCPCRPSNRTRREDALELLSILNSRRAEVGMEPL